MATETLLLVEKCSHCISYYDIESGKRTASIPLPEFPHEFVVDSENKYAYIGHYGVETSGHRGAGGHVVFQLDVAGRCLVRTIDLDPYNRIHGLQMDAAGRLYALSEDKAVLLTLDDPRKDDAPKRAVPVGGIKSHLFALTKDGQYAYAMNLLSHTVTKVKPHDATFLPVVCAPGEKPEGNCLSLDEKTLFVTCRWSNTVSAIATDTMQVLRSAPTRDDATRLYQYRDGRIVVTNYGDRSLSIIDSDSLQEIAYAPMETRAIALSFHPEKPIAFVSQDNDKVGYFNLESGKFERFIQTQKEPDVSKVLIV
jgi:DNA-binding beta-propeller fold protein YncE